MNHERPRTVGGGVPLTGKNATPKLTIYGKPLPRLSGSTAINGSPSLRMDDRPYSAGANGVSKEKVATPVKGIISPNVTPRSGSRKARAETASPSSFMTPNDTPTTSRAQSSIEKRGMNSTDYRVPPGSGIYSPTSGRTSRSESLISDGLGSSRPSRPVLMERNNSSYSSNGIASPNAPAMFFHANDVQATVSSKQPTDIQSPQPEILEVSDRTESEIHGWMAATSNDGPADDQSSKFFYANDVVHSKSPPPRSSSGTTSNRPSLQTIYSAHGPTTPQRAPSPLKEELIPPIPRKNSISKASPRRHTRLVSSGGSEIKAPEANKTDLSRRSSVTSRTAGRTSTSHVRSSSVHSLGQSPSRRHSIVQMEKSLVEPAKRLSLVEASGVPSLSQDHTGPFSPSLPQSPTKPPSKLDQMNELAANARRERKVLDLEISNSSLLAINRTLEREMRKQNAELRRYRRLSRSGRLSVAPTSHPSQKVRRSQTEAGLDSDDLFSSDSEIEDGEDVVSARFSGSNASDSPTSRAARNRFQDPEHSSLDLSAHRLLLLESQKMNQSIKRCLKHTDALIAAGRQALDYQAQEAELQNLGPKVLTPDESHDGLTEQSQGLLSPGLGPHRSSINPWERSLAQIGGLDGGLETPDYSKWTSDYEAEVPAERADDDGRIDSLIGMPIGDGAWASEMRGSSSSSSTSSHPPKRSSHDTEPRADDAPPATTSSPTHRLSLNSTQNDEDHSFQASLDGLDSKSTSPSPAPILAPSQPQTLPQPRAQEDDDEEEEEEEESRPPSPTRPPATTNAAANTPGNRSSIQNFGTYLGLQSLSIFGGGGGTGG